MSLDKTSSPAALRFAANRVEEKIKDLLDAYLHNVKYEPNRCSMLTHNLCKIIKDHTKQLHRQLATDRAVATAAPVAALTDSVETSNTAVDRCDDGADVTYDDDDRWKLIVHIVIGQDSDQSVLLSSRCIWNADTDCLASATYRNNSLFAVATVYGLRCDNGTTPAVDKGTADHLQNAVAD